MGEISYDFNLLFRDEERAIAFAALMQEHDADAGHELVRLVNRCCNSDIESHGFEFDISSTQRFRNEIQITCYTGRSSETPMAIVGPLKSAGAEILKISALYDDAPDWERFYFVDGKKVAKRSYEKAFREAKIEDITDQLQRLLSNNKFREASKIVDECDLDRIRPEDDFLSELIGPQEFTDLAIKLLHAGMFDQGNTRYEQPWLPNVVESGQTRFLKACLDYGMDPYATGKHSGYTALHRCATGDSEYWLDNVNLIIERCRENLNPVTSEGSPLWLGYDQQANVAACVLLQNAGAEVIPPESHYDSFSGKDLLIEAAKHCDVAMVKTHFATEYYFDVLYWSLRHNCFDLVRWLDGQKAIDWDKKASSELTFSDDLDQAYADLPFCEVPLLFVDGPKCDPRLIDFIIDAVPSATATYSRLLIYIARMNHVPQCPGWMEKLIALGAEIDRHAAIDCHPEPTCAIDEALQHECLGNAELLFKNGVKTAPKLLPSGEPLSGWADCLEGEIKRRMKALFKQYGVL